MLGYMFALPIYVLILIGSIWRFFRAEKRLYLNEELFMYTPAYDMENVKKKHRKIWLCLFAFNFFPLVLIVVEILFAVLASDGVYEAYRNIIFQPMLVILFSVWVISMDKHGDLARELREPGKTVGRYMVYPRPGFLAMQMAMLLNTITAFIGSATVVLLSVEMDQTSSSENIMLIIETLSLPYLINYAIIRYFYVTPRELVLGKTAKSDYDTVAKRYYGIWRNRLILANLVAGAQLILGGFVTLTNAGEHLMGIRILGLVILAIVFIYILIQSREFEDPVVVKGMVYPSEKKRVTLKWVILSAIALYTLGAIILL